jgi:hypothetical protein
MEYKAVISQPMFFPWHGLFAQAKECDLFMHLVDVQMPGGQSFMHRVKLKGKNGIFWWGIPIDRSGFPKQIKDIKVQLLDSWLNKSIKTIEQIYTGLKFKNDVLDIFNLVFSQKEKYLYEINIKAFELICKYLNIVPKFYIKDIMHLDENPSVRLQKSLNQEGATIYITGHGAKNYLDHTLLERNGISVKYIEYNIEPYEQYGGDFDQYVSILDLIAHKGPASSKYLKSKFIPWREFINE